MYSRFFKFFNFINPFSIIYIYLFKGINTKYIKDDKHSFCDYTKPKNKQFKINDEDFLNAVSEACDHFICDIHDSYGMLKFLIDNGANVHAENYKAFHIAISKNNIKVLKLLKGKDRHFKINDKDFLNAVSEACDHFICDEYKSHEMVKFLIDNGANVHAENYKAFHIAISKNNIKVLKILKGKSKYIKINDKDFLNAVSEACDHFICDEYKSHEMVKFLIDNGANVHAENYKAFQIAISKNNIKVLKILNEKSKDRNDIDHLYTAIKCGNIETVKKILYRDENINYVNSALSEAIKYGNIEMIKIILDRDINGDDSLSEAIKYGNIEIIKMLLKQDVNVDNSLSEAFKYGNNEILKMLLDRNVNVDNALSEAIKYRNIEIVKMLLKRDVNVNSALSEAIKCGNNEIIKMLLDRDFNVNDVLSEVFKYGNIELIKMLLKRNINIDNALSEAFKYGNNEIIKMLMDRNFNVNRALSEAIKYGNIEIVKMVLNRHVNVNIDEFFLLAIQYIRIEIINYLLSNYTIKINDIMLDNIIRTENILLIERFLNPENINRSFLMACHYKKLNIVDFIVQKGADIKVYGREALNIAVRKNNEKLLKYLLKKCSDIDYNLLIINAKKFKSNNCKKILMTICKEQNKDGLKYIIKIKS